MSVPLRTQHACLNAHNILSFSAKYAQVTGMRDGLCIYFFLFVLTLVPLPPLLPTSCGQQRLRNRVVENFLHSS